MRRYYLSIFLLSLAFVSCSIFSPVPAGEAGNVEEVSEDDVEMNAAIQKAQDTLPLFIRAFQSPKPSQSYFGIKSSFPYGDGNSKEHIWLSELSYTGKQFEGVVGNEPVNVQGIKPGDHVWVPLEDISDWMIIENNQLLGGFTIHVLRNNMTQGEREQFDNEFGVSITDDPALP